MENDSLNKNDVSDILSKGFLSLKKIIFLTLLFSILSFIAYQYQIVLYFIFFLYPLFYLYLKNKLEGFIPYFSIIITWFIFNTLLLRFDTINILNTSSSLVINFINVLIISWINFFLYFVFFIKMFNNKIFQEKNKNIVIGVTVLATLINTKFMWENYFNDYLFELLAVGIFFSFVYSLLMHKAFIKGTILKINFILSLSPLFTLVSAIISIFFVLNTMTIAHNYAVYLYSFYFLSFFQLTLVSSVSTIFFNKGYTQNQHTFLYRILLFILINIGILLQYQYISFLKF